MSTVKETSTTVRFWAPYTATFAAASSSVEIKAPEEGNKERRSRNQSIARTRAGNVFVYDRGINNNADFSLDFREVTDSERSQLIVFLEAIQWASTKVCYQDMYGDIFVVRILQEKGIEYEDRGTDLKRGLSRIRWNFSLALLNLTGNLSELAIADGNVSNALTLHLTDYDSPHDPESAFTPTIASSPMLVERYYTTDWRTVLYTVIMVKGTATATFLISVTHNRNNDTGPSTAATTATLQQMVLIEAGDVSSHISFTAVLEGSGVSQFMSLKITTDANGWLGKVRRTKMGKTL